ncbi:TPA: hypothetical protein L6A81_35015 [Pseudomonas aeruginosa]|nr:hypothetical protein [Pseudomonas aeruginosa]
MNKESVFTRTITHADLGSVEVSAEISPCCWMYNSDFQLSVTLPNGGGRQFIRREGLKMKDATQEHVDEMLGIGIAPCRNEGCSNPAFDPKDFPESNRKGECEHCFMTALSARAAKSEAAAAKKLQEEDERMKKDGYTHRVDMVVHRDSGDDQFLRCYAVDPTKRSIIGMLKRRKSKVLDDYRITQL